MPEATYVLKFNDFNGDAFEVEELGQNILDQLRRSYALDKFIEQETNVQNRETQD